MAIPAAGNGDAGGGVRVYGRVCSEEAEYGRTIHCDADNSRPLRGYGADDRGVGSYNMVVTGGPGPGGSKGGGGRRMGKGGGERKRRIDRRQRNRGPKIWDMR